MHWTGTPNMARRALKRFPIFRPPEPQPSASLVANPDTLRTGGSATLTWMTAHATSVTLNEEEVEFSGSRVLSPGADCTYTLVATGQGGRAKAVASVAVAVTAPPPSPTVDLLASPSVIESGQSSTLTWVSSNATEVTLEGEAVPPNGPRVVSPAVTSTFTLQATGEGGSVSKTLTITARR